MTAKVPLATEQIVAIVCGFAVASATIPRNDIARYFSSSLGEIGGYVAGLFAMGISGALVGALAYGLIKWFKLG